ncbi:MAG: MAC/perforin domain-containing protein [Rhodospirillales bacterium]
MPQKDPKEIRDQLKLASDRLGQLAEIAEELADEEDVLDFDSDPDIAAWKPTSQPGVRPGAGIPTLPPKTKLDLSQPEVNAPDIPEFKIPAVLSVAADSVAVTHPGNLTQGDWLIIARNSRILYAYTMGSISDDDEPPQAGKAALDWMVPDSTDFMVPRELSASVLSKVTYTAETASYVRAGFDKQQASVGFPLASASFEREHKEKEAGASYKKQLQMIGRWYYPRVQLNLKDCATASDRFKTAVRTALDAYDKNADIKLLLKVFKEFGTAVPSEVILGGQMLLVHTEDYEGSVNEQEVENVISAAVSIKTTKAEGSIGASFQNAQGNKVSGDSVNKATTFTVKGGDSTKASDPQNWPSTVKPPSQWAVIGRSKLTSIVEWLPDDLRSRVLAVWPKVPLLPAIWDLQETIVQDHNGKAAQAQFVLGGRIVHDDRDGARGAVQLICGSATTPQLGQGDAVGGRASFHRYRSSDVWIDTASVCLPVPAGLNYTTATPDTSSNAISRFAIAETNLTFGSWRRLDHAGSEDYRSFMADTDGFVFCCIEASNDGNRGYATCTVDKVVMAAASVHNYARSDNWIKYASFCVPFAKGSSVEVKITPTSGTLSLSVWHLPYTSQAWMFKKPELITPNTYTRVSADGFVNGILMVPPPVNGPRGTIRLDCVKERPKPPYGLHGIPIASAAVHVFHQDDRWISHSSAMIPVRKDYLVWTGYQPTSGAPEAKFYFTQVVPIVNVD